MLRHILLTLSLIGAAIAAGVAVVPGEREQWTMLIRDNRNEAALEVLDARYRAGQREPDAVLQLYRLLMSFAEIARATEIIETFAAQRPDDVVAVTLLAKHHGDTQNRHGEIAALERLFALSPSSKTARTLLSYYRLEGAFGREEKLLLALLANRMIVANDAERLGLMLLAQGDLDEARAALVRFDEIANPERMTGRFALFDVMVRLGETKPALARAAGWIPHWRKVSIHRAPDLEFPAARLIRMMLNADAYETQKIICALQDNDGAPLPGFPELTCPAPATAPGTHAAEHLETKSAMTSTGSGVR
ncbi:MAG: hypothetical protein QOI12_1116 [Alphaproteobacteria bacterium]|jgi:tetratricopeptide (TPR) repeat protein|nr:hypothetical protein [Alphaproteobacteria bacterium]